MKLIRRATKFVALVAFLLCSPLYSVVVHAQVLDQVPEQAIIVVKVNNLQSVSTKFGKLATDLQLVAQVPPLADPLGALTEKLKITNGLDKGGDGAFAFIDPAAIGGDNDNAFMVLWPVTDYKAFLANFGEAKEENGISEVTIADSPKPAYFASWGKYAVMTPSKEIAAMKPTGVKVAGATAKEMSSKDVVLLANMPMVKTKLQPMLAQVKEEASDGIKNSLTGDMEKYGPLAQVAVTQFIGIADAILRDAQGATYGITFADNGISATTMVEFDPASYSGTLSSSMKNSDASMLEGIPSGKYLFFGGSVSDPAVMGKAIDDFMTPITAELTKAGGAEADSATKYVDSLRKYIMATQGTAGGLLAPSGALGQEPIIQMVSVQTGDAAAMKSAYQDMLTSQQDLMKTFNPQAANTMKTTITPNAKTVDGVNFDLIHTEFTLGQGPAAAQADNAMKMIYGPDGMNVLTGVTADKLVIGFGANDQTLSDTLTVIKAKDDPLAKLPGVAAVATQLPKSRAMTMYIPLDQIVTTAGNYASAMGMPIQIQLPGDLPPIGVTFSTDGSAMRIDSYTPTDLIKALVAQGMQIYMQRMGGGGGPGGPGGL
jgi:hypothetical protein